MEALLRNDEKRPEKTRGAYDSPASWQYRTRKSRDTLFDMSFFGSICFFYYRNLIGISGWVSFYICVFLLRF
ncbi:hypothetical protein IF2G_00453 [Cordyceps javanica]|nr:hypothetical protein IF2G_00453 [Cordyceps javanica]